MSLIRFPCSSSMSTHRGRSTGISVNPRRLQSTIDPKQAHCCGQAVKVASSRPEAYLRQKFEQIKRRIRLNIEFFILELSHALRRKKGIFNDVMDDDKILGAFRSMIFEHLCPAPTNFSLVEIQPTPDCNGNIAVHLQRITMKQQTISIKFVRQRIALDWRFYLQKLGTFNYIRTNTAYIRSLKN